MNRRPILILLTLAALAFPASAIADAPAITQYTIVTPTSKGPKQVGNGSDQSLNPKLARQIPAGDQDLRRLVSTPGLGASPVSLAQAPAEERPSFLGGVWDGIGGSPTIWLLLGLAGGTLVLIFARRGERTGREPPE